MQLALSQVHARLVPMQRDEHGYALDPSAEGWLELPAQAGFAGYGLGRALRMLLDVLRGLTALHDTFDAAGVNFVHGEVALPQFRVDSEGVCRLVPLTTRHSGPDSRPKVEALGYLAPERLLGEPVDVRADVFSAGVLLWEALAGRRLFSESSTDAIIDRLMGEKLPMPQLPPELAWAIPLKSIAARALSVDPYQRFADCAELATAIAIVARERVATHAEIAAFFGPRLRTHGSVAQTRPVPTRSSTFPSVNLPVAPASISGPPSSRNGFPLAIPTQRAITPVPRSITPMMPRSITSEPRSITPVPRSIIPEARSVTPVPRSAAPSARRATLPPPSSGRAPQSGRAPTHKSAFATLIGTGDAVPASHRRKTLTSVGTPSSVLDSTAATPDASSLSATPPASWLPPALPGWATSFPSAPAPSSQAPTSSSQVVARSTLESIPLSDVAKFRSWSPRRSLIAAGAAVLAVLVIALIASLGGDDAADAKKEAASPVAQPAAQPFARPAPAPAPAAEIAVPEVTPVKADRAPSAPMPHSVAEPSSVTPSSVTPKEPRPIKVAPANQPANGIKEHYGI
jgi:serine/threonine-protein kinase